MFYCNSRAVRSFVFAAVLGIAGSGCTGGMGAAVESLKQAAGRGPAAATPPLDPKFVYLRVTRGKHVGLMWRGSLERSAEGTIEVFYSGSGEVVRLRNGRLVGALGLNTEWRQVDEPALVWRAVAKAGRSTPFVRTRDVMPGYRTAVRDELALKVVAAPERSALQVLDPKSLTWFEETVSVPGATRMPLLTSDNDTVPAARFAADFAGEEEVVVYGEQCLARDFCFTWQRWSTAMQQAATASSPK